jgi:hypothetical protein
MNKTTGVESLYSIEQLKTDVEDGGEGKLVMMELKVEI